MNLSHLKKDVSELKNRAMQKTIVHVEQSKDYAMQITCGKNIQKYTANSTAKLFHSSKAAYRAVMGPYGSGKSTMCLKDLVDQAIGMPKFKRDGIRRSKFGIVRNTTGDLEGTTLETWLEWFGELGCVESHKKPVMTYIHRFNDKDGQVEMKLVFLAMDRPADIRKLKSNDFTGIYLNEASELVEEIFIHSKARINRYPRKEDVVGNFEDGLRGRIVLDYNPPDIGHWLYNLFEEKCTEGHKLFKQPPGLIKNQDGGWVMNTLADNVVNLPDPNYYVNFARGQTEEFIKVFCLGAYGILIPGKKVHPNYNDDIHSVDEIEVDFNHSLYLGWDFGFTPACLISQFINGQRRDIKEFVTKRMGLRELAKMIVKPFLNENYDGMTFISRSDPSGGDGSDELHEICILNEEGIPTQSAKSNNVTIRLDATDSFLNRLCGGGVPAYIVSKKGCPELRKGFLGKYCRKRLAVIGEEQYADKPNKIHPTSDIQDCGQYTSLEMMEISKPKPKISEIIGASSSEWV